MFDGEGGCVIARARQTNDRERGTMRKTAEFLIATALAMLMAAPVSAYSVLDIGPSGANAEARSGLLGNTGSCLETFDGSQFCNAPVLARGGDNVKRLFRSQRTGQAWNAPPPTVRGGW